MPSGSLGRLTQLTNSYLWDTSNDLLGNTEKGNIWGHFMGLERVTFGSQSNTYYRVAGLKQESINGTDIHCDENCSPVTAESKSTLTDTYLMEANHIDVELNPPTMKGMSSESGTIHNNYDKSESSKLSSHRDTIAPQLILQCSSSLTSTLYCRLIQRCLLATVRISEEFSLPNSSVAGISTSLQSVSTLPHSSSTPLDQPSHPRSSSTSSASSSSSNNTPSVVWVPGAGAAEMGWSALWGVMSQKITTRLHSEIAGLNYVSSQTKIVPKEMPGRITFLEILDPLADILIDSILHRIKQKYHFIHLKTLSADKLCKESPVNRGCNPQYARAVQHFIEFSTLLSHAYAEIPKLLLLNASSGVDGTHRISKNAENIWSHWKDHYMTNPTECNANPLIDISESDSKSDPLCCSGRLGLVCPFGPKGIHLER